MNPPKLWPTRTKCRVSNTSGVKDTALIVVLGELIDSFGPQPTNHKWWAWHSEIGFILSSRPPAWCQHRRDTKSNRLCLLLRVGSQPWHLPTRFFVFAVLLFSALLKGCLSCQGGVLSDPLVVVVGPVVTIGRCHVRHPASEASTSVWKRKSFVELRKV